MFFVITAYLLICWSKFLQDHIIFNVKENGILLFYSISLLINSPRFLQDHTFIYLPKNNISYLQLFTGIHWSRFLEDNNILMWRQNITFFYYYSICVVIKLVCIYPGPSFLMRQNLIKLFHYIMPFSKLV